MSKLIIDCDKERAEGLYQELTKLQAYMTGWRDAGKLTPPGSEAIWQLRGLLKNGKEKK